MSIFLNESELETLTGCATRAGTRHWLESNNVPYTMNGPGTVMVRRADADDKAPPGLRTDPFFDAFRQMRIMERRLVGIYFLLLRGEVIYIGKTTTLFVRMAAHDKGQIEFDTIWFMPLDPVDIDDYECEFIARYQPRENINLTKKPVRNRRRVLPSSQGKNNTHIRIFAD